MVTQATPVEAQPTKSMSVSGQDGATASSKLNQVVSLDGHNGAAASSKSKFFNRPLLRQFGVIGYADTISGNDSADPCDLANPSYDEHKEVEPHNDPMDQDNSVYDKFDVCLKPHRSYQLQYHQHRQQRRYRKVSSNVCPYRRDWI